MSDIPPGWVPVEFPDGWFYLDGHDRIPVPRDTAVMRLVALGIRKDGM